MKATLQGLLFLFFFGFVANLYGQSSGVAIDADSRLWLGLNFGGFWQSGDLRPDAGSGGGLTFDYHVLRNTRSVFGLAVRAQYLKASSLGLGITRDYRILNNTSLNGTAGNPNYASLPGGNNYVFQNYNTDISDVSGALLVSLNRLRAATGINLYVFGGLGATQFLTTMDQLDASGNLYTYNSIDETAGKDAIKKSLKDMRDGAYETYGEAGEKRKWAFTPTVGAGFAIQLSKRFQLGIEHKVGFTGTDLLDGNQWNDNNELDSRNDVYHYAQVSLQFGLGKLIGGNGNSQSSVTPSYQPTPAPIVIPTPAVVEPPIITVTSPTSSPVTVENCMAVITATIRNMNGRQGITVTQNGIAQNFRYIGNNLTLSGSSFTGTANYVITATNSAGTATETISFICPPPPVRMIVICHNDGSVQQSISIPETDWAAHAAHGDRQGACPVVQPRVVLRPVIRIISPTSSPVILTNCVATVAAVVGNVPTQQGITVTQSGTPVNFSFVNGTVTVSNIEFTGTANFVITATNTAGRVTESVSFVCQPPIQMITICHTRGGAAPQTIDIPESEWNAHAAHGDARGTCPVILPPVVRITLPAGSPTTLENCSASVTATVENITARENIKVTQNGNPVNFTFASNTVTVSDISFTGSATFVVTAINSSGSASQTTTFVCQPPVRMITICHHEAGTEPQTINIPETVWAAHAGHGDTQGACPVILPPVVRITSPASAALTVENCVASVTASIENITNKQGIAVTQNGNPVDFVFANKTVTISNVTFTGTANFVITATNVSGTSSQTASFICQPVVRMITICHKVAGAVPQTINIPETAWGEHEGHGDTQGTCPVILPPVVKINPSAAPTHVQENCVVSVTASTENITTKEEIAVTQNGKAVDFTYADNAITVSNITFTGTVNVVITAKNVSGSISQTASFLCQPPVKMITICHAEAGAARQTISIAETDWAAHAAHGDTQGTCPVLLPPLVRITTPTASSVTVEDCKASVSAVVQNVSAKEFISVTQNGNVVEFEYADGTVKISDLAFTETATFVIKATNSVSSFSETVTFICKPKEILICHYPPGNTSNPQELTIPEPAWAAHAAHGDTQGSCPVVPAPELVITSPSSSSVTTDNCIATIEASVKNALEKSNVTVTQNGVSVNFDYANDLIRISNVPFTDNTTFNITVANRSGSVTKSMTFVCQPVVAPVVVPVVAPVVPAVVEPKVEEKKEEVKPVEEKKEEVQPVVEEKKEEVKPVEEKKEEPKPVEEKKDDGDKKITICHHPPGNRDNFQTITISESAWPAHERHGDTKGACE